MFAVFVKTRAEKHYYELLLLYCIFIEAWKINGVYRYGGWNKVYPRTRDKWTNQGRHLTPN